MDRGCSTYTDKAGRQLIYVKFHRGIFDAETLQVGRQEFAVVRIHGEQHTIHKRNHELPSLLLHGIADQGVPYGMESIGRNRVMVGSSEPHGVFHISADREDAYQTLNFYNSGCVLLTATEGFVVDRDKTTRSGKFIKNPYDWVGAAYKGVVASQVRNIGREYVVRPESLMILGALFDKAILQAFLSTRVELTYIQRAHAERTGNEIQINIPSSASVGSLGSVGSAGSVLASSVKLSDDSYASASAGSRGPVGAESSSASVQTKNLSRQAPRGSVGRVMMQELELAPCEPDIGAHLWISTRAQTETGEILQPVPDEACDDDERARKSWSSDGRTGVWGDSEAPDGIRRTKSRSRTPPGVRRKDSDYSAMFTKALRASVERCTTSAAASASTQAPLLPSMGQL